MRKTNRIARRILFVSLGLCFLLVVACGGGGSSSGGGGSVFTPLIPRTAPTAMILNTPDDVGYAGRKTGYENSAEYDVGWTLASDPSVTGTDRHLHRINAAAAYARGATGAGQTITIMDTGIRDTHREFAGNGKVLKTTEPGYMPNDMGDKFHGTAVAALALGNRDSASGLNMHGVAFGASVDFVEIELSSGGRGFYTPLNLAMWRAQDDQNWANRLNQAVSRTGSIINFSFGIPGGISRYSRSAVLAAFPRTAALLAQANTHDADKKIIVWAAGNANGRTLGDGTPARADSPQISEGLGVYFTELRTHVLAVVALDQDGTIAGYSNRCGLAKSFCLAAPGSNVVSASWRGDNEYFVQIDGTSFAAPLVSGSLAVLSDYFAGQLGNTELVDRLLATANRNGIYTDSDTYGHGLVDLDAATRPVGTIMSGLPGTPDNRALAGSGLALAGPAFGALQGQLAEMHIAGFDSLGAPFLQPLAGWVSHAPTAARDSMRRVAIALPSSSPGTGATPGTGAVLSLGTDTDGNVADAHLALGTGWWLSYKQHGEQFLSGYDDAPAGRSGANRLAAPYLQLVGDGGGFGWSRTGQDRARLSFALLRGRTRWDGEESTGGKAGYGALLSANLGAQKSSQLALSVQAGAVRETDGFLGAKSRGVLGEVHALTTFAGLQGAWRAGDDWHVLSSAYFGRTHAQFEGGALVSEVSPLQSSAFNLELRRESTWRAGDNLILRLSQPLRVEKGEMTWQLPSGRTRYGEVLHQQHDLALAPSGRTMLGEAAYHFPIADGQMKTSFRLAHQPQHDSTRDAKASMQFSFAREF